MITCMHTVFTQCLIFKWKFIKTCFTYVAHKTQKREPTSDSDVTGINSTCSVEGTIVLIVYS